MGHQPFTPLLVLATALTAVPAVRAQSLADAARRTADQRQASGGSDRRYTAKDLPGSGRVDEILGDFVMTEVTAYRVKDVRLALVKARRLDLALDRYLLKWEFATRGDPFGMAEPLQAEPRVLRLFDREHLEVREYLFYLAALDRALADQREPKVARANLTGARLANVEFVEHYENLVQPWHDLTVAQDDLERDRKFRARD